MATAPELLQVLAGCDKCGDAQEGRKYANVDGRHYCRECWDRAGCPFPKCTATESEQSEFEIIYRQRTTSRGPRQPTRSVSR